MENKLHKKEHEHDVQQPSKVSQIEEDLAMPRPEAVEDLKIDVRDSIMNVQHLIETHKLRLADVSGRHAACPCSVIAPVRGVKHSRRLRYPKSACQRRHHVLLQFEPALDS